MKTFFSLIIATFLLSTSAFPQNNWHKYSPSLNLYGGEVSSYCDNLFLNASGRLFKSIDNGLTWEFVERPEGQLTFSDQSIMIIQTYSQMVSPNVTEGYTKAFVYNCSSEAFTQTFYQESEGYWHGCSFGGSVSYLNHLFISGYSETCYLFGTVDCQLNYSDNGISWGYLSSDSGDNATCPYEIINPDYTGIYKDPFYPAFYFYRANNSSEELLSGAIGGEVVDDVAYYVNILNDSLYYKQIDENIWQELSLPFTDIKGFSYSDKFILADDEKIYSNASILNTPWDIEIDFYSETNLNIKSISVVENIIFISTTSEELYRFDLSSGNLSSLLNPFGANITNIHYNNRDIYFYEAEQGWFSFSDTTNLIPVQNLGSVDHPYEMFSIEDTLYQFLNPSFTLYKSFNQGAWDSLYQFSYSYYNLWSDNKYYQSENNILIPFRGISSDGGNTWNTSNVDYMNYNYAGDYGALDRDQFAIDNQGNWLKTRKDTLKISADNGITWQTIKYGVDLIYHFDNKIVLLSNGYTDDYKLNYWDESTLSVIPMSDFDFNTSLPLFQVKEQMNRKIAIYQNVYEELYIIDDALPFGYPISAIPTESSFIKLVAFQFFLSTEAKAAYKFMVKDSTVYAHGENGLYYAHICELMTSPINESSSFCEGDTTIMYGQSISNSTTFDSTFVSSYGCEINVTHQFNMIDSLKVLPTILHCETTPYNFYGLEISETGLYTAEIQVNNCPQKQQAYIEIDPILEVSLTDNFCEGQGYILPNGHNTGIQSEGEHVFTYDILSESCDTSFYLSLTLLPNTYIYQDTQLVMGNEINGIIINEAQEIEIYQGTTFNGCDSILVLNIDIISSNDELKTNTDWVTVTPNPFSEYLNVDYKTREPKAIEIYDLNGKKVDSFSYQPQINTSRLSPGIYFIKILSNHKVATFKIIKL